MLPLVLVLLCQCAAQQWNADLINFKACLDTIDSSLGYAFWYWQPSFTNVTDVFNVEYYSSPLVYFRPSTTLGVSRAVACANAFGITTTARSGGHSYAGFSRGQNYGMSIDLAWLNGMELSPGRKLAWLGAGNRVGRVMQELTTQEDVFVPPGTGPTIGLAGYTLGGGQGVFSRKYGYMSDNVLAIEAVLADGSIIQASPMQYQDLFWAMRGGGGGNFAIATEFKVRTFPAERIVSLQACSIPSQDMGDILSAFGDLERTSPDTLGGYFAITQTGSLINLVCLCSVEMLQNYTRDFVSILPSASVKVTSGSLYEIWRNITSPLYPIDDASDLDFDFPPDYQDTSVYAHVKNVFLPADKKLDVRVGSILSQALTTVPNNLTAIANIELVGGAMRSETDIYPSAIYNRNASLLVELNIQSESPLTAADHTWLEQTFEKIHPLVGTHSYVNLIDPSLREPGWAYYGKNLEHLKQVAQKYDPQNIFDFPMAVRRLDK